MPVQRAAVLAMIALSSTALEAQQSSGELSRAAANPTANLMSVPFQNNTDFGLGPNKRTSNVLNIQPVIPLVGGRIVTRTIFPFVWIPDVTAESGLVSSGLSDIRFTAWYVPPSDGVMWGVGPVLEFPSGGELRGSQKWSAGVSALVLVQPGEWTIGVLADNVWSFAGDSAAADVNRGLIQYFVVYQLGDGWYLNSAPINTVDWNAAEGQKWKVPVGAGGGKVLFVGKLPVNLQSAAYYYVVKPDIGPEWQLRVQAQFLLPTPGSR